MNKSQVINRMLAIIKDYAEKYNLEISDPVYGEALKNNVWEGLIKDDSDIPNIVASNEEMVVELCSFWWCPELSISSDSGLLVLLYRENSQTNQYEVFEFKVDGFDYSTKIKELENIIKFIES